MNTARTRANDDACRNVQITVATYAGIAARIAVAPSALLRAVETLRREAWTDLTVCELWRIARTLRVRPALLLECLLREVEYRARLDAQRAA